MKNKELEIMNYLISLDLEELFLFKGVIDSCILKKELEEKQ